MVNAKQSGTLPKPPAGEYVFTVKRAGIKDGAVWFVLGNDQYDLLQYVDLRKNALFRDEHCTLAAIIAETGWYCGGPEDLIGRTVEVRVVTPQGYVKIADVRAIDHE
jgi:hypothetical protein